MVPNERVVFIKYYMGNNRHLVCCVTGTGHPKMDPLPPVCHIGKGRQAKYSLKTSKVVPNERVVFIKYKIGSEIHLVHCFTGTRHPKRDIFPPSLASHASWGAQGGLTFAWYMHVPTF